MNRPEFYSPSGCRFQYVCDECPAIFVAFLCCCYFLRLNRFERNNLECMNVND